MIVRNSGLIIPNDHPDIDKIKKDLTIKQTKFNSDEIQTMLFYQELNDSILIPRYYPIKDEIFDENPEGEDIRITSNIVPDGQTQIDIMNWLETTDRGILKALPGIGKTVCAIETICRRRKKTLIVAHKKSLISQWKKELLKFTDLHEDDIGILTTSKTKYKEELDKPVLLTTPHVIGLALSQNKFYFIKYLKECGIGLMIVDEVHAIVGAEMFTKSSITVNAKTVIGLSATPERSNETDKIINYHLGDVKEFDFSLADQVIPRIVAIKSDFQINKNHSRYINYGGKFDLNKYCIQSKKSEKYSSIVLYLINKAYDEGRSTIIVGNYIDHVLFFAEHCKAPKEHIGVFFPTAKPKEILNVSDTTNLEEAFLTKQLVFGSYGALRDGNNRKDLSCAIMLTPCSNVVQLVGRITRKLPGKPFPIAFDLVDTDPSIRTVWNSDKTERLQKFEKAFQDRMLKYDEKKWPVKISVK